MFPPGSTYTNGDGERWHLLGWAESADDVSLIFTVLDPFEDFDRASQQEHRRYACMSHFMEPEIPC